MSVFRTSVFIVMGMIFACSSVEAALYKCQHSNGKIEYSDSPCPNALRKNADRWENMDEEKKREQERIQKEEQERVNAEQQTQVAQKNTELVTEGKNRDNTPKDTTTDFTDLEKFEIFSKGNDALVRYQLRLKSLTELSDKWADAVRLAEKLGKDKLPVSGNVKLVNGNGMEIGQFPLSLFLFKDRKNEVKSEATLLNKLPLLVDPVTVKLDLSLNIDSTTQHQDVAQTKDVAIQQGHKSSNELNKDLIVGSIFFVTWISFAIFGIIKKWSVVMFMGGGFFIACVVLVLAGMLFPAITSPLAKETSGQSTMAFIQCKNYVRNHLKAPSTADFPFIDNMTSDIGNGVYVVNSYVDAQNGFGAMIRSTYQCKVQYIGGDNADQKNWRLIDIEIK